MSLLAKTMDLLFGKTETALEIEPEYVPTPLEKAMDTLP